MHWFGKELWVSPVTPEAATGCTDVVFIAGAAGVPMLWICSACALIYWSFSSSGTTSGLLQRFRSSSLALDSFSQSAIALALSVLFILVHTSTNTDGGREVICNLVSRPFCHCHPGFGLGCKR